MAVVSRLTLSVNACCAWIRTRSSSDRTMVPPCQLQARATMSRCCAPAAVVSVAVVEIAAAPPRPVPPGTRRRNAADSALNQKGQAPPRPPVSSMNCLTYDRYPLRPPCLCQSRIDLRRRFRHLTNSYTVNSASSRQRPPTGASPMSPRPSCHSHASRHRSYTMPDRPVGAARLRRPRRISVEYNAINASTAASTFLSTRSGTSDKTLTTAVSMPNRTAAYSSSTLALIVPSGA